MLSGAQKSRDAGKWWNDESFTTPALPKGQRGWMCIFITESYPNFMFIKIDLEQIFIYSRTQKNQNGFLSFLLLFSK